MSDQANHGRDKQFHHDQRPNHADSEMIKRQQVEMEEETHRHNEHNEAPEGQPEESEDQSSDELTDDKAND